MMTCLFLRTPQAGRCAALALLGLFTLNTGWATPLKVCVSDSNPPLSVERKGVVSGFDVTVAKAIATGMGRELRILAFESELEKESLLTHEVNALLSAGVCDLVSGFPLLASDLGAPTRASAKTPDYPGAKRKRERPFVALGTLVASQPYQGTAISVVQRSGQGPVRSLADLRGRRVGVVAGSLEGAMVAMYRNGELSRSMVSLSQREDSWAALESGRIDTLLVTSTAFDAYRQRPQATGLEAAEFQRSVGINLGFVALANKPEVLEAANRVISQAGASGELTQWAREAGMRWQAPSLPAIASGLSLPDLLAD
ncbi:substrate-binding periplasmic protein [Limnohabitans sp.]|jgi:ABC-type amino acid transport substrate-binding protein|uniref:substrate-binding periplasmic protein n=1 Tax=Limnohabitans sp. TaxID=1907725 RepID=UPI0037BF0D87